MELDITINEAFWTAAAFMVIAIALYRPVLAAIKGAIGFKQNQIELEFAESKRLKEEARKLLDEYQEKERNAVAIAQEIIANTERMIGQLEEDSQRKIEEMIEKRTLQLNHRLDVYQSSLVQELQTSSIEAAFTAANVLLKNHIPEEMSEKIYLNILKNVSKQLH